MSIKYERPTNRRMMLHFDKEFLDMLPIFKEGLGGRNETKILRDASQEMAAALNPQSEPQFLDIGSGDGDWIRKLATIFREDVGLSSAKFTALEPVSDNPKLKDTCRRERFTADFHRIEECDLKSGTYDIVTSTHSAYYYYNQPLAHEVLFRLLKPGGWMIVTLVSQFCVLNALTEEILGPHHQFALNAESYISLVSKLGLFSLRKVVPHEGGSLNVGFYTSSSENIRALEYILARHRLPVDEVEREHEFFAGVLRKYSGKKRLNLIMFFQKPDWIRAGPSSPYSVLPRDLDLELESLREELVKLAEKLPLEGQGIIELDIEAFTKEVRSGRWRHEILEVLGHRLLKGAEDAGGQVNRLQGQIDLVIEKLKPAT
jgi:ubiquinone/menaquinone biosynthesis C-methylase UbiE